MSRTKKRNALRVWNFLLGKFSTRAQRGRYLFTAGEVSKGMEMSIPTIRAYLDFMVANDALSSFVLETGATVYTLEQENL